MTTTASVFGLLWHLDFVNVPTLHSLDSLHKMVVENGGTFSMNLNSSVTHCVASESKGQPLLSYQSEMNLSICKETWPEWILNIFCIGLKFQAAKRQGDCIHYSWLLECCAQKQLIPLQPKSVNSITLLSLYLSIGLLPWFSSWLFFCPYRYFLFLSEATKKKLEEEVDEFSDSYYLDLNVQELKQVQKVMTIS